MGDNGDFLVDILMTCQNVEFPLLETFIRSEKNGVCFFFFFNMQFQIACLKYFVGSILNCRQVALMNKFVSKFMRQKT